MNARAIATALLLGLAPAVLPVNAFAQNAADDAATKTARARFQEGVAAFDKGQYDTARVAFLQAYALKHHPTVLLNLAQSCLKGSRWQEAAKYFQQYQHDARDASAAQKEAATQGLAEARVHLGRVEVVAPAGTDVFLDEDRVGVTPIDEVDVAPGGHTIKLRGADGREESHAVLARAGERSSVRAVGLAPAAAAVSTAAPPPPAPEPTPEPVAAAPEPESAPPAAAAAFADETPGAFTPPDSMAPFIIASAVAVVGVGMGIAFGIQRNVAQSNADKVEDQIFAAGGTTGTCTSTDPAVRAAFGEACSVLEDNRNIVSTDATVANVSFIVAGAAAATAIGWYFLAPKSKRSTATIPVMPLLGPKLAGAGVSGSF